MQIIIIIIIIVLVAAQPSLEVPEGLINYPVYDIIVCCDILYNFVCGISHFNKNSARYFKFSSAHINRTQNWSDLNQNCIFLTNFQKIMVTT
jgi:hypothetical protein